MAYEEVNTAFGAISLESASKLAMSVGVVVAGAAATAGAWAIGTNAANSGIDAVANAANIDLTGDQASPEVV